MTKQQPSMKSVLALIASVIVVGSAVAQPNIGVSIGINQPGIYGRINIGDSTRPAVVLPQPIVVMQPAVHLERQPIYLYVPPAHQQNWTRYCGRYSACGQPVYFVQEQWVREQYQKRQPAGNHGRHKGWDHSEAHGSGRGGAYEQVQLRDSDVHYDRSSARGEGHGGKRGKHD